MPAPASPGSALPRPHAIRGAGKISPQVWVARSWTVNRGKLPVGLSGDAVTHEEYPIVLHHDVTDQTGNPS
jgi:hypothetical protein